jgi:anti-sigma factor ChrR (cupin superfamily)
MPGPVPDSFVFMSDVRGPKLEGAFCGFVKMGPSVTWPTHRHLGHESMLILEGGFRQHDGVEVHPGDLHVMEEGSAHGFTIFDDETCIAAAVIFGGIAFDDPAVTLGDIGK